MWKRSRLVALGLVAGLGHPALAQVAGQPSTGAPVPAAPAAERASSADIDLSAIGLDPLTALAFDDRLAIYGFADIGFLSDNWGDDLGFTPRHTKTFMVGDLNLYLSRNLTARARTLAEIRFTFLPNGSRSFDGSITDNTVTDPTNFYRPTQWGGIIVERAYAEFDLTQHLTLRAGHWLTPYGIWNIDHGSPVVITPTLPFIIGEQFFPEHQTGLELFGDHYVEGLKLGYHLTASNGRGAAEAQSDQDNKFAFGGRLQLETPWGLRLGGSYYRGRYTGAATAGAAADSYLEQAYGADLRFERGPLLVQAELIARDRHRPASQVEAAAATGAMLSADGRDFGVYALAGYRFERLWNVMPFVFWEDERPSDRSIFTRSIDVDVGLNFRPTDSLVFKAVALIDRFEGSVGLVDGHTLYEFVAQTAWAF